MLSKFTYTANLGRAAVTLDLLQVGVINTFSRQTGRITYSLYDDQKTHIFNITTVFRPESQLLLADININLGIWYLLFPAPFSHNLFQSFFYYYTIKYCPLPCQCKGNREPFCISKYSNFLNLTVPACTSARYCSK